jgi:hypothetical protein
MAKSLAVTATAAANTGVTLTLPAVTGESHYITSIHISRTATAALAGSATLVITSTNIGGLTWSVGNAMSAGGTQNDLVLTPTLPIQSDAPGTATTIVCPVPGAAVLWRVNVTYYTGVAS